MKPSKSSPKKTTSAAVKPPAATKPPAAIPIAAKASAEKTTQPVIKPPVSKPTKKQLTPPAPAAPAPSQNDWPAVTLEANIDVGFGNRLYLRGEGDGLSWNEGVPLTCQNGTTWKWVGNASKPFEFKFLLNDSVWARGENLLASPGQRLQFSPSF